MNCSCWGEMLRFAPATNPGVRPKFVRPYLEQLRHIAESGPHRMVRVHSLGAVKAADVTSSTSSN